MSRKVIKAKLNVSSFCCEPSESLLIHYYKDSVCTPSLSSSLYLFHTVCSEYNTFVEPERVSAVGVICWTSSWPLSLLAFNCRGDHRAAGTEWTPEIAVPLLLLKPAFLPMRPLAKRSQIPPICHPLTPHLGGVMESKTSASLQR